MVVKQSPHLTIIDGGKRKRFLRYREELVKEDLEDSYQFANVEPPIQPVSEPKPKEKEEPVVDIWALLKEAERKKEEEKRGEMTS